MNLRAIILTTVTGLGLLDLSGEAQVYNVHLVTDNQPDYTDFDSFVQSSTGTWKTPEEKCIAVWRWGRRSRHQLSCSREGARHIMDPILNYNSYGALNCGIILGPEPLLLARIGLPGALRAIGRPHGEPGLLGQWQELVPVRLLDELFLLQSRRTDRQLRGD